jgi:hypothetical protein
MVIPNTPKEFYEQEAKKGIEYIRHLGQDIGFLKRLREENIENEELEILISAIIWEEQDFINTTKEDVLDAKARSEQLE